MSTVDEELGTDAAAPGISFADLPSASGSWPEGHETRVTPRSLPRAPHPDRRTVLRGLVLAGAATASAALGVFPRARPALAHHSNSHYGYRVWPGGCPAYAGWHNCMPGCGPSPVYADTCVPSGPAEGWFKNAPTSGYRLRPGQCIAGYDGWMWRYSGTCGWCRTVTEYRCHDGYRLSGGGWYNAICREVTECDGRDPEVPTTNNPLGQVLKFDVLNNRHLRVKGWAMDPNHPRSRVPIEVKRGSVLMARRWADQYTRTIPPLFRVHGLRHGFDIRIRDLPPGTYTVRVNAVNLGPGRTTTMRSRSIRIPRR